MFNLTNRTSRLRKSSLRPITDGGPNVLINSFKFIKFILIEFEKLNDLIVTDNNIHWKW